MSRLSGIVLIAWGILSYCLHEWTSLRLPLLDWPCKYGDLGAWNCSFFVIGGVILVLMGGGRTLSPQSRLQWRRFRSSRRGFVSFLILGVLVLLAMLDSLVVGSKAIAVRYEGRWSFPAFHAVPTTGDAFGLSNDERVNFRELQQRFREENKGNWVIMPPVPWDPVFDSDVSQTALVTKAADGLYYREDQSQPYSGSARRYHDQERSQRFTEAGFRRGRLEGRFEAFLPDGTRLVTREYTHGEVTEESWATGSDRTAYPLDAAEPSWVAALYAPLPPSAKQKHYLGTDSRGWDLAAQIFGGWQVNVQAGLFYLLLTYLVGITIGCTMGYFGGTYDLTVQRIMEIMMNVPFLYLVVIIVSMVGRENVTVPKLIGIMAVFSWIGVAVYLRASTYRERERVFVGAAQVIGASHPRIIFRHILPNVLATIVTLIPFDVSGIIFSLTALAFIGFGLPDTFPSWGVIFDDGVDYLSSPWIASSAFAAMVVVLALITFVGEAIRDAFDPKKFAYYQ